MKTCTYPEARQRLATLLDQDGRRATVRGQHARRVRHTPLLAPLIVAATISCSSGASSDASALSGPYQVSGVRVLPSGTGDPRVVKFTVVSSDPGQVIFDFDSGDVARPLPARDTALMAGGYYTVSWNGNATFNHVLSFRSGGCLGYDVTGAGDRIAWATCTIQAGR